MKIPAGSTNVSVYYYVVQDASNTSPGEPVTGLLFSDIETGGSASYARQGAARVDLTLITLASASAGHSDGGFILVDDTNMPGLYRCDYPDAAFASGVDQTFLQIVVASGKNAVAAPILVDIEASIAQTADHTAGIADIPTVAEFEARTIVAANYFDPANDDVAVVTLVNTLTTYTNDTPQSADNDTKLTTLLARIIGTLESGSHNPASVAQLGALTDWIDGGRLDLILDIIAADTTTDIPALIAALNDLSAAQVNAEVDTALTDYDGPTNAEMIARTLLAASYFDPANDDVAVVTLVNTTTTNTDLVSVADILTTQMTEAYAANGIAPTMAESLFAIHQMLMEFSIAGTAYTVKKLDSSTTAFIVTLSDATNPTGNTR